MATIEPGLLTDGLNTGAFAEGFVATLQVPVPTVAAFAPKGAVTELQRNWSSPAKAGAGA